MGPVNLTKILAIFFSGALLMGVTFIYFLALFHQQIALEPEQYLQSLPTAFISAILIPASLAIGLVVEGASDITVRRYIFGRNDEGVRLGFWPWPTERRVSKFLGQEHLYLSHALWKQQFAHILSQKSQYSTFMQEFKDRQIYDEASQKWTSGTSFDDVSQISASLIFQKDNVEIKNWIMSHYSTYFASANFLIVVLFSWLLTPSLFWASGHGWIYFIVCQPVHFVMAYFLASNAFDRFFYSHLCAYRYCALILLNATSEKR